VKAELAACCSTDELAQLFEVLDLDGGGVIDIEEFVEGLSKIAISRELCGICDHLGAI